MSDQTRLLVTVGGDAHAFDRLVDAVDTWMDGLAAPPVLVVHHGAGHRSRTADRSMAACGLRDLRTLLARTHLVVSDASAAVVREARRAGHVPMVLPRRRRAGEARLSQNGFARHLARRDLALVAPDQDDLRVLLNRALQDPTGLFTPRATRRRQQVAVARATRLLDDLAAAPLTHDLTQDATAPHVPTT